LDLVRARPDGRLSEQPDEIVQIIGRVKRDAPGKTKARFTNLIAEPMAAQSDVVEAVNDTLKAIAASLLEQVLAPKFDFTPKNAGPQAGYDYGDEGATPQARRCAYWHREVRLARSQAFLPWVAERDGCEYRYADGPDASRQCPDGHELRAGGNKSKAGSEHESGADGPAQKGSLRLVWGCVGFES